MVKSPLRYPGGKSRAVNLISTLVPDFSEFREPFLGGGSVYLHLKQKFPAKKYWINDLYTDLYIFWKTCQNNIDGIINQVYKFKKQFSVGKELNSFLIRNFESFGEVERAAAFFVFNRITFSGTTLSGGYSEQAFAGRFTLSSIERLTPFAKLLDNALITNFNYSKLLDEEGDGVFIFLDPPYYSATKSALYGKNGNLHKSFNHIQFAEKMRQCRHKWLITYDDSEYIRNLFSFANIVPWDLSYGMRNVSQLSNQTGKELFISNYDISIPNQLFSQYALNMYEVQ